MSKNEKNNCAIRLSIGPMPKSSPKLDLKLSVTKACKILGFIFVQNIIFAEAFEIIPELEN